MADKGNPQTTPMVETFQDWRGGGEGFSRQMVDGKLRTVRPAAMPETFSNYQSAPMPEYNPQGQQLNQLLQVLQQRIKK